MKFSKLIIALCAIGIISFLLTAHVPSAWAEQVIFKVTVNPVQMNVHIVSGKVQGNTNAEVKIELQRKQNSYSSNSSHSSTHNSNSSHSYAERSYRRRAQRAQRAASRYRTRHTCIKISQTRIVDTRGDLLDQNLFRRGCYFTVTRVLQPFSTNELQQACATSSSGTLVKKVVVNTYKTHEDVTKPDRFRRTIVPVFTAYFQFKAHVTCSGSASSTASHPVSANQGEKLFAQCVDRNTDVAVQVDMTHGTGNLYLNGNSVFNLTTKYLSIRESMPDNLIELKGNGLHKMYLDKSRKTLYFREGSRQKFCQVIYKEGDNL